MKKQKLSTEQRDLLDRFVAKFPTKTLNQFGVAVFSHTCPECKRKYTVTPYPDNPRDWMRCMALDCPSYDPKRDCDHLFGEDDA